MSTLAQAQAKRLREEQTKKLQNAPRDDEESDDEQSKGGKPDNPRDEEESDPESDDDEGRANKRTKPNNTPTKAKAKPAPTEPTEEEERQSTIVEARALLMELRANNECRSNTSYGVARLPSLMALSEGKIDASFSNQSRHPDAAIRALLPRISAPSAMPRQVTRVDSDLCRIIRRSNAALCPMQGITVSLDQQGAGDCHR